MSWLRKISRGIDALNEQIGRAISWIAIVMVAVVTWNVFLRLLFHKGSVAMQELEWALFGPLFLLTAGYTLVHNEHVRVDIFYSRLSARARGFIDFAGSLLFLIPVCILGIWTSLSFVAASWVVGEVSPDPGGLPARYILKAVIPLGFFLLGLQGFSMAIHGLSRFLGLEGEEDAQEGDTFLGT
ncbi:MAG: TRAP transporter small permease subunit [candidate division NC10 bacterium]|nr:TRAP transporter small permease subunit [candidate division NC10 bacterium]